MLDPFLRGPLRAIARRFYQQIARRTSITIEVAGERVRFEFGSEPALSKSSVVHELEHFTRNIRRGDIVADVGAFEGTFTVIAAACTGSAGRIVAFEPSPESRAVLERNMALNGFQQRVTIVPAAVAAATGSATLYSSPREQTSTLYASAAVAGVQPMPVRTVSLDDYFEGERVDLIKIDVEGAEFAVLRGAQRLLGEGARVLCEIHPYAWAEAGHTGEALLQWLALRGRRMVWLGTNEPVTEFRYGNTELLTTPG